MNHAPTAATVSSFFCPISRCDLRVRWDQRTIVSVSAARVIAV
ncbi:hypothetical protein GGE56_000294 [Rhizobium leguminosarum]|nr:hypothetical protein [Rhizobium leguminosarum]MBB6292030.1 hypothetical protein [Rhizobium leguminosarum]